MGLLMGALLCLLQLQVLLVMARSTAVEAAGTPGRELYRAGLCEKFSQWELDNNITEPQPCWTNIKPEVDPPACSPDTPHEGSCTCSDVECTIPNSSPTGPDVVTYVCRTAYQFTDVAEDYSQTICTHWLKLDQWNELGLATAEPDTVELSSGWKLCPSGYAKVSGSRTTCRLKKRYMGAECWDGWFESGKCAQQSGDDEDWNYKLACYTGSDGRSTCTSNVYGLERNPCECATVGVNLLVVCQAKTIDGKDQCNGHWCVLNEGNGKKFCDYAAYPPFLAAAVPEDGAEEKLAEQDSFWTPAAAVGVGAGTVALVAGAAIVVRRRRQKSAEEAKALDVTALEL